MQYDTVGIYWGLIQFYPRVTNSIYSQYKIQSIVRMNLFIVRTSRNRCDKGEQSLQALIQVTNWLNFMSE